MHQKSLQYSNFLNPAPIKITGAHYQKLLGDAVCATLYKIYAIVF